MTDERDDILLRGIGVAGCLTQVEGVAGQYSIGAGLVERLGKGRYRLK